MVCRRACDVFQLRRAVVEAGRPLRTVGSRVRASETTPLRACPAAIVWRDRERLVSSDHKKRTDRRAAQPISAQRAGGALCACLHGTSGGLAWAGGHPRTDDCRLATARAAIFVSVGSGLPIAMRPKPLPL